MKITLREPSESQIQSAIQNFLTVEGLLWWRCNLGGVRRSGKGWTKNPMSGFPDLAGILDRPRGGFFAIEVKRPGKRPEPHQAEWHRKLTEAGVLVVVASSVNCIRLALELHRLEHDTYQLQSEGASKLG